LKFVMSVKDKDAYNELLDLCRSGKLVELLLKKLERRILLKSGKGSYFRMTVTAAHDGKPGTNCIHLYTLF